MPRGRYMRRRPHRKPRVAETVGAPPEPEVEEVEELLPEEPVVVLTPVMPVPTLPVVYKRNEPQYTAPSVLEQRSGVAYYSFPKHHTRHIQYFNPSLAIWKGFPYLVARRRKTFIHPGRNDIVLWKLDAQGNIPPFTNPLPIHFHSIRPDEHFEDPRAVVSDGMLYVSYSTFLTRGQYVAQGFAEVNTMMQVSRKLHVDYGNNGSSPAVQRGNEKNWVWFREEFDRARLWRFVYSPAPQHIVVTPLPNNSFDESRAPGITWEYGLARGGTPPVLVMEGEPFYWSFFHSSIDISTTPPRRRYYMGAYAFEPAAPFRPVLMTKEPLLIGSASDPREPSAPLCVFPCGALYDTPTRKWTVSMGINDCACARLNISHDELVSLALPV